MSKYKYAVMVDDNFHFMDESERYGSGQFETYEAAVVHCKNLIDSELNEYLRQGFKPEDLYRTYAMYGEDPFIVAVGEPGNDQHDNFSARGYAKEQCEKYVNGELPNPGRDIN